MALAVMWSRVGTRLQALGRAVSAVLPAVHGWACAAALAPLIWAPRASHGGPRVDLGLGGRSADQGRGAGSPGVMVRAVLVVERL